LNPLEKLTEHLGFDPTTEPGTLRLFQESVDRASRVLPSVRIKEIKIVDLDSEWFQIVLDTPNHRISLEVDIEIDCLFATLADCTDCPATITFPSGTLGGIHLKESPV